MSDITLLGFDPAGIGKEKAMSDLTRMSGEELLGDGYCLRKTTPFNAYPAAHKAEILRRFDLSERAEKAEALAAHGTSMLLAEQARVSELIADRNRAESERDQARAERDDARTVLFTVNALNVVIKAERDALEASLETARTALTTLSKLQVGREFIKAPGAKMSELFVESRQIATNALAALALGTPEAGAEKLPER